MNFLKKIRKKPIYEGGIYNISELFDNTNDVDYDPKYYDLEIGKLKLGSLCAKDIKNNVKPNINLNGNYYTTYCALVHLSNTMNKNLVDSLHHSIKNIYDFLRSDLNLDNKKKFHTLMSTVLGYTDTVNTLKILSDLIDSGGKNEIIKKSLDKFRFSKNIDEEYLDTFLKQIKSISHTEYENSFYGEHFIKYNTQLRFNWGRDTIDKSFINIINNVLNNSISLKKSVDRIYSSIIADYNKLNMVKSDLKCIKDLKDEDGNVIIKEGSFVEVKKIDYGADSYLSEFFSIYKNPNNIPTNVDEVKFLKIYNRIIDDLYEKLSDGHEYMLKDVGNNFAGIFYDDKYFIKNEDIELYWSNRGRSSCLKDHRLSIRYKLKNPNVISYIYDGSDVLKTQKIALNRIKISNILDDNKILCPIIREKSVFEVKNTKNSLLFEGRVDDSRKKYPKVGDNTFKYYVNNDPSGNQKYLDWLMKNTHLKDDDNIIEVFRSRMIELVSFFHKKNTYFEVKDINAYTPNTLSTKIEDLLAKIKEKEDEKLAKKQKTVVYDDKDWYVVSPHTWKSSCFYGAGTKWCVASKDRYGHWDKYTKNAILYYVIDKRKTKEDDLYKVAYRKIGHSGKFELWNAVDFEFSKTPLGVEWLKSLPKELLVNIDSHHLENLPKKDGLPEWVIDDPRAQAIINHVNPENISDAEDYIYGLPIYSINDDDEYWVAGTYDELVVAQYDGYIHYSDEELVEHYDDQLDYIIFNEEDFIDKEIRFSLSDDNIVHTALEFNESLDEWEEISIEIDRLEKLINKSDEEDVKIKSLIRDLKSKKTKLLIDSEEAYKEELYDDWRGCLHNGVVDCLINIKGYFNKPMELLYYNVVELDRDGLIMSLVEQDTNFYGISQYGVDDSEDDNGEHWYVFKVDY